MKPVVRAFWAALLTVLLCAIVATLWAGRPLLVLKLV